MHAGICLPANHTARHPFTHSFVLAAYTYVRFLGGGQVWQMLKKKEEGINDLRHFDDHFLSFYSQLSLGIVGLSHGYPLHDDPPDP